ncbi:DUF4139 domain-containing protein [Novosphingobium lentum]|uniref:DUF4139 domain-containing protein n=1 Tax=Novosphingobium lentum TaxID=145287 RepID=UPI00083326DA|nr:hypothetical protein [Novosphingobium lentum]
MSLLVSFGLVSFGLVSFGSPARAAPPVVLSAAPDAVSVTLYRDPDRGEGAIDRANPSAFALIAETRTVTLPPGVATVRFEGVAGGIVPQSAILFGTDPRERNRDAALLSQKGLVDAFTGQQVILRRTDPATGKTVEERATIRSAANRLVIDTPRGAEAVYCSGLAQTLLYPEAPATLSAKPVLTMTTKDQPGGTVSITLAYIATGFDWDATYVGTLATDGKSLNLFAWLTMASGDETSFVDATTSAVAGRVNRSDQTRDDTGRQALQDARWLAKSSQCWPAGTTSDIAMLPPPAPPPPPAPMMMGMVADEIMVTARRSDNKVMAPAAVMAKAENLGDLKLYRIPVPVTVAARSQKQVAFLNKPRVTGALVYRSQVNWDSPSDPQMLFRFRNSKPQGLGDPLPAGKAVLYQDSAYGRQLVGESTVADKTLDEDVELVFGHATNLTVDSTDAEAADKGRRYTLTVRNANPFPARFELEFIQQGSRVFGNLPGHLLAKPGKKVWAITLPANGQQRVSYDVRDVEDAAE